MDERFRSFIMEYGVILALAGAGVIFLAFGIFQLNNSSDQVVVSAADSVISNENSEEIDVYIDVAGAVNNPGLYALPATARVADAIEKAGGVSPDADPDFISRVLNKAQIVQDGQKVFIPSKAEAVAGVSSGQTQSQSNLINVNTASLTELDTLPGVGEVTAQKIVAGRPYSDIDELRSKKSVTNATYEKIKDMVSVY